MSIDTRRSGRSSESTAEGSGRHRGLREVRVLVAGIIRVDAVRGCRRRPRYDGVPMAAHVHDTLLAGKEMLSIQPILAVRAVNL